LRRTDLMGMNRGQPDVSHRVPCTPR